MRGLSCNSNLLSLNGLDVEQSIALVAELGYQGIDISLEVAPPFLPTPLPHMSPEADVGTRRRVRRCAERAGVAIVALNAHTSLVTPLVEKRNANIQFVRGALQLAADLGASCVVVGGGRKEFYGYEAPYWERLVEALRVLVALAGELGIRLAVEAGSFPGSLVHNVARMQRLLGIDGLGALGVLFDPGHYHVRGDSVVEAYSLLRQRIVHVHAKDARGHLEDFAFPPLGMGDINFADLVGALVADGYVGYLSVEYEGFAWGYEQDARRILSTSKAFLDQMIAEVSTAR